MIGAQWPKCGEGEMISVYKSQDKLGFVSLKVPHHSYDFEVQGMHADLATGRFQVQILSEPPTTVVEIIQCQVIIH